MFSLLALVAMSTMIGKNLVAMSTRLRQKTTTAAESPEAIGEGGATLEFDQQPVLSDSRVAESIADPDEVLTI